jgi:hypothetical protein
MARQPDMTVVALALVLLHGAPAYAQWIVSAYGGAMHTQSSDVLVDDRATDTNLRFDETMFESRSSESPIYYGYRVGHRLPGPEWLFVEGELIHGKLYPRDAQATSGAGTLRGISVSNVPFESVVQDFNLSHGLNFILINALARRAFTSRVALTARLGAGPMLPHVESVVEGVRREDYQWAGIGVQVSGGAELTLWRRLAVTAEYKWTRARPQVSLARGRATLTTTSHHIAIGVAARF